jgi:hypothetical protein
MLALWTGPSPPETSAEQANRQAIAATTIKLLDQHDFAGLNRVINASRTQHTIGPNGTPTLPIYYQAITDYFADKEPSKSCSTSLPKVVADWNQATPHEPAAIIAKSMVLEAKAWCVRGHGVSSSVERAAWPVFFTLIADARQNLVDHKAEASIDPNWYVQMEGVILSESWPDDQANRLFDEAAARYPDYLDIYFAEMDRLLPQWYGGLKEMENFAEIQSAKTQRVLGDRLYAKLYWHVFDNMPADNLRGQTSVNWPHMKRSMEAIANSYPDVWNLSKFARISCLSGDKAETKLFLTRLNWTYSAAYWEAEGEFKQCSILARI